MDLVAPVNESNCYNDTDIIFSQVFSTASLAGDASALLRSPRNIGVMSAAALGAVAWMLL